LEKLADVRLSLKEIAKIYVFPIIFIVFYRKHPYIIVTFCPIPEICVIRTRRFLYLLLPACLFLTFLSRTNAFAVCSWEIPRLPHDARSQALACATVALPPYHDPCLSNPAGICGLAGHTITLFTTRLYGLPELPMGVLSLTFPIHDAWCFGVRLYGLGRPPYREWAAETACAVSPITGCVAGISLLHGVQYVERYNSTSNIGLCAGARIDFSGTYALGGSVTLSAISTTGRFKWSRIHWRTGALLRVTSNCSLLVEGEKEPGHSMQLKIGCETGPAGIVCIRMGMTQNPALFCCGIAVHRKPVTVNYALTLHSLLGATHGISLTWHW
jgi:hypothetical protein